MIGELEKYNLRVGIKDLGWRDNVIVLEEVKEIGGGYW